MFYGDPTYLCFVAPGFLLVMLASWYVNSAYNKWGRVAVRSGLTGAQAAQRLINSGGLSGVQIDRIGGKLSDNYDPRTKVLHLSQAVADTPSVAAVAVAAHELGHAMQDNDDYVPLRFRSALVPAVNIGSWLGWIMIFAGLLLGLTNLAWLGVLVFSGGAVFALATLPVELNASARAKRLLAETGIIAGEDEQSGVNSVLNAAALTYVAGLGRRVAAAAVLRQPGGRNGRSTARLVTSAASGTSTGKPSHAEQRARACLGLRKLTARSECERAGARRREPNCYNDSRMRKILIVVLLFLGIMLVIFRFSELEDVVRTLQRADGWFVAVALLSQAGWFLVLGWMFQSIYAALGLHESKERLTQLAAAGCFVGIVAPSAGFGGLAIFLADGRRRGHASGKVTVAGALYALLDQAAFLCVLALGIVILVRRQTPGCRGNRCVADPGGNRLVHRISSVSRLSVAGRPRESACETCTPRQRGGTARNPS